MLKPNAFQPFLKSIKIVLNWFWFCLLFGKKEDCKQNGIFPKQPIIQSDLETDHMFYHVIHLFSCACDTVKCDFVSKS